MCRVLTVSNSNATAIFVKLITSRAIGGSSLLAAQRGSFQPPGKTGLAGLVSFPAGSGCAAIKRLFMRR
jgi:hypothetical protein